jgi:phospholipase/carboxylesterase
MELRLDFIHRFEAATKTGAPALLLLHGAGGDENSLMAVGRAIAPGAALLSPRGKVEDSGSSRFFERSEEGQDDHRELNERTEELAAFVSKAANAYGLAHARLLLLGFSAGATIGVRLLLRAADHFGGAVLMRGLCPIYGVGEAATKGKLAGKPVLLLSGIHDPLVQTDQAQELAVFLREAGAEVTLHWEEAGHSLSQGDVLMAFDWVRPFYVTQRSDAK